MDEINKIKSISIWIFIVPFVAVNTCLILITQFHGLFPNQGDIIHFTFPYFDGGASISRTARPYPSWLVFKPAMFLTSFLLIKYWIYNKKVIEFFHQNHKYSKRIIFFGIASAVALTIHAIFLGIKFDNDLYKFTMQMAVLANFPNTKVSYEFKDRRPTGKFNSAFWNAFNHELQCMAQFQLRDDEIEFIKQKLPFLN